MNKYPRRLIEVSLPIRKISHHARREKAIGPISRLHVWWARRPLVACRAVTCAALWPDPVDELCPSKFRETVMRVLPSFAEQVRSDRGLAELVQTGWSRWSRLSHASWKVDNPGSWADMRYALLDFIADFANWDASDKPAFLETARELTKTAYEALGSLQSGGPLVFDPFAGGGAIPLESLRVGANSFASDLNPVAVLLNKILLEFAPRYGSQLAEEVLRWGRRIYETANDAIADVYPVEEDGATPIAYLWARTILSEAPDDGTGLPVELPLIKSLWLSRYKGRKFALRWLRRDDGSIQTKVVVREYADGVRRRVQIPLFEVFEPGKNADVEHGTVSRSAATCPVTQFPTPISSVREQLSRRNGGTSDARLLVVVYTKSNEPGRWFRTATDDDMDALDLALVKLGDLENSADSVLKLVPDEPTPRGGGKGAGRAFSQRNYGLDEFGDFFNARQALAMATFASQIVELESLLSQEHEPGMVLAIKTCLAMALGREADHLNSGCAWNPSGPKLQHLFARPTLPIIWDFAEANPFGNSVGDWFSGVEQVVEALYNAIQVSGHGQAQQADAANHPLPDNVGDLFFTDPPYYDAVPYSDLSDFLYIWLRRSLRTSYPDLLDQELTPKDEECIVDDAKGKDHSYFENKMTAAMREAQRVTANHGIGVVVFAHKTTSGWESLLQAMIDAKWTITGSWPIDTEHSTRLRAMQSAALASSIHLVCRPRIEDDIGDWRNILQELPSRISHWLPQLAREGIVGADAIFACLGPALEIFSRYDAVERADGSEVLLSEYLEYVWAAVSKEALDMVFAGADTTGFEADARLTAIWLWTLRTDIAEETNGDGKIVASKGYELEYDAARKIAQGLGAHLEQLDTLVEVKGSNARLLPVAERGEVLFGKGGVQDSRPGKRSSGPKQLSLLSRLPEEELAKITVEDSAVAGIGHTVLDMVHQSMLLFAAGQSEALKRFLVDDGIGEDDRFWSLAQALSALYPPVSDEKRWVDGVLARKKALGLA